MTILPRRFEKLKSVLNCRMADLTVVLENVEKPHNISAILRSCDAVGLVEVQAICKNNRTQTFNSTAQGSQKWVRLENYPDIEISIKNLKERGFKLYGTNLGVNACSYIDCDFTGPTAFFLGAEKWGLSKKAMESMDQSIFIPMRGMVQSLNVSVAAATLLFEAFRQREGKGVLPKAGEGLTPKIYKELLFEWAYPEVACWCKKQGRGYPDLNSKGEILEDLPRTERIPH